MGLAITSATFAVAREQRAAVADFYLDGLRLEGARDDGEVRVFVGAGELRFAEVAPPRKPFYHFAILVPGDRFEAAHAWLAARAALLTRPDSEETVFDFDFWDARACYAHDPAGNILELIAHHGLEESAEREEFGARELRGISEVGAVTEDLVAALERLQRAGLELWSGQVEGPRDGFGFVGRKAHSLILCPTSHPWLPTLRPAESHPLSAVLRTDREVDIVVRVREDASLEVLRS
jgi:hypothetical protein